MTATHSDSTAVVLYEGNATQVAQAFAPAQDLWLTLVDLEASTGWELEPEGVCRDELCVPIPAGRETAFLEERDGEQWFNLTEFARLLDQPYAHDSRHDIWAFGPALEDWRASLTSNLAPDFTLPDLEGVRYTLSDFRGKKVLLACWASW